MSAVGNDSMYVRELNLLMRGLRDGVTVEGLKSAITSSHLTPAQQNLALVRLRFAEQFVRDGACLRDTLRPGRLVVVDLRDELIETDEALGLFVVMLRVFAGATYEGRAFSKLIAFDEAHKYIRNTDLLDSVVSVIRQMRHQATSVLIASQDPPSLPLKVVELSSLVMLHRMDSPAWLKHIQKAVTPLGELTPQVVARLRPGEAYLWARSATDPMFTNRAVKVECRPRVTKHGGTTKTATG
jgi:DNA helicase HerA-like ATPase